MPDGCELSARIWMPENANERPVPAILEHLPYRKRDGTIVRDQLTHPWFAANGYACIRVDMRGNGDSQGVMLDEYTEQELDDAYQVIAWAAQQPFCNGAVGMMGISWGGFNALQVAAMQPPALKAIITLCSTVDRFADDIHYKGGCLLGENIGWSANMLSYSSRPPDPALVGDRWRDLWMERLENMPFLASNWLSHQHRDDYWKHGSVCEDYASIKAAVLSIGGWHDGYRNTISHLVGKVESPVKGIVGPWIHKYPHYAAPQPAIGFLQEAKRWWDHWLKDEQTGVQNDAAYRVWLMDSIAPARWLPERPGRWIAERNWPSYNIEMKMWHLQENARLNVNFAKNEINCVVNSRQTCGQAGGEYFPFMFGPELPDEQSVDDAESIVFDSGLLKKTLDIVGAPEFICTLIPQGTTGNCCVRLCDIRPDGQSALITMGVLNLSHYQSSEAPATLIAGEPLNISITLDQIAYRLPAGHRLRLAISSAYWPFIWPAKGQDGFEICSGALELPCRTGIAANDNECQFEAPQAAPAWDAIELRPSSSTRELEVDQETGVVRTIVENDFGENKDADHGLISGSSMRECWSIHPDDALSAKVTIEWQQNGGRDDWQWSTLVLVTQYCDATHFHISGYLRAMENDTLAFEAEYLDSIPREFV